MKPHVKWMALVAGLLVLGVGIGRAIVNRKAQEAELSQSTASAKANLIVLGDKDIHVVANHPLTRSIPVSGTLTAQRSAIVKAKVASELLSLNVREGDQVQANQVIGKLDPQEYETRLKQASQQAEAAKAQWQIAQQNLENNQALVKQGYISRNALDTSLSNAASTRANYDAAQSAVDLASKALRDSVVRAPIGGLISKRFVQAGERVGVDGRIVEIVDLASLELQAPLSPQDVLQIQIGSPATLRIDGLAEPVKAHVARINPSATADTRSVMVYLAMPRQAALRQGLFAQGQIMLDQRDALALPWSAVTRDSGQDQVLRIDNGKVVKTKVSLNARASTPDSAQPMVEVLDGLHAGDQVLVNAAGTVHEGQAVQVVRASSDAPQPAAMR